MTLPLEICQSCAGFYIGTCDEDGPVSRESAEYFPSREAAAAAFDAGDWTPRAST
jgi:hypothetical protein